MATGKDYLDYNSYGLAPPKDQVAVTTETVSSSVTVSKWYNASYTKTISKSGYTPIGIVGSYFNNGDSGSGWTYCNFQSLYLSGSKIYATVIASMGNVSDVKAVAEVLWIKN